MHRSSSTIEYAMDIGAPPALSLSRDLPQRDIGQNVAEEDDLPQIATYRGSNAIQLSDVD
jgi:hypothetical protein